MQAWAYNDTRSPSSNLPDTPSHDRLIANHNRTCLRHPISCFSCAFNAGAKCCLSIDLRFHASCIARRYSNIPRPEQNDQRKMPEKNRHGDFSKQMAAAFTRRRRRRLAIACQKIVRRDPEVRWLSRQSMQTNEAVGSVVGQIAKVKGCRAVGIAGGPDKCRFVVEELGPAWIIARATSSTNSKRRAWTASTSISREWAAPSSKRCGHCSTIFARVPVCGLI
jgi:hypothetical protein